MRLAIVFLAWSVLIQTARADWQIQHSPTHADLRAVHAVSDQVAWASGAEGTVLRTIDGGGSWQRCAVPQDGSQLDFRGIQAFDAQTAVVMSSGKGQLSRLYKTTDGCKTWDNVLTNPDPEGAWDSIQFQFHPATAASKAWFGPGVLVGHPVGGEFVILTSRDYGSTWITLHDDQTYEPGPSAFAREGEQLFSLSNSALTATADKDAFAFVTGGQAGSRLLFPEVHHEQHDAVSIKYTFTTVALPIPASPDAGAFSIASRRATADRADFMIVGGEGTHPGAGAAVFVRHGDNLTSLKKYIASRATPSEHPPSGPRSAVAYDSASNSWIAVGLTGTDVSRDDGRTWTPLSSTNPDSDRNWQALSLPFVVGPGGRIGKLQGLPVGPAPTLNASR